MKPIESKPSRRNFLLGATLGTAATAAAIVAGVTNQSSVQAAADHAAPAPADAGQSGYRLTAHIAQYYDTTKL